MNKFNDDSKHELPTNYTEGYLTLIKNYDVKCRSQYKTNSEI